MLSHKALKARLKLLVQTGVSDYQEGDFRVTFGRQPSEEQTAQAVAQFAHAVPARPDPENPADLVLFPPAIEQDN